MHLLIRLVQDNSGYPPFSAEEVDATEVADHTFRLEGVPAFAFGLARGDVVRTAHDGSQQWIEELIEPSGHSAVRVIGLAGRSVDDVKATLELLGCLTFPTVIDGMIAVDVPPHVDFDEVRGLLLQGRELSHWDFSEGVRGDGRD